jgi:hypothetical protein
MKNRSVTAHAHRSLPATAVAAAGGWLIAFALFLPAGAHAQVVSQGRGVLTLQAGQGSGPTGATAAEIAGQTQLPKITQHAIGWRVAGGYNFGDYVGAEAAISRIGYMKSSAPYHPGGANDQVNASTALNVIEANLVGRLPLAARARIDLTLGLAETSLDSTLSTQLGSSLPSGQSTTLDVRRFGYDAGIDAEWMLGEHLSLIVGYHEYPNAGSARVVGSANGPFGLFAGGIHVEF